MTSPNFIDQKAGQSLTVQFYSTLWWLKLLGRWWIHWWLGLFWRVQDVWHFGAVSTVNESTGVWILQHHYLSMVSRFSYRIRLPENIPKTRLGTEIGQIHNSHRGHLFLKAKSDISSLGGKLVKEFTTIFNMLYNTIRSNESIKEIEETE